MRLQRALQIPLLVWCPSLLFPRGLHAWPAQVAAHGKVVKELTDLALIQELNAHNGARPLPLAVLCPQPSCSAAAHVGPHAWQEKSHIAPLAVL